MNSNRLVRFGSLMLFASVSAAWAQTTLNPPAPAPSTWGNRVAGDHEFTLGASGSTNTDFDDSSGSLDFSYGMYLSPRSEIVLRQNVGYSNPSNGGTRWHGTTVVAYDWHLGTAQTRPFFGVSLGGVYGDDVRDTWSAGLEVGAKHYVGPRTFIYGVMQYQWFFQDAESINDRFDTGSLTYSFGIGFHF
jgi:hypothetical protein